LVENRSLDQSTALLETDYRLPRRVHNAIISRIKNLSRLDMPEKWRPQDGQVKFDRGGVEVEICISSFPTGPTAW